MFFEILEDGSGQLYLVIFENGYAVEILYGFEHMHGVLAKVYESLSCGLYDIVNVGLDFVENFNQQKQGAIRLSADDIYRLWIYSNSIGCDMYVVADSDGIYPDKMGLPAIRELAIPATNRLMFDAGDCALYVVMQAGIVHEFDAATTDDQCNQVVRKALKIIHAI